MGDPLMFQQPQNAHSGYCEVVKTRKNKNLQLLFPRRIEGITRWEVVGTPQCKTIALTCRDTPSFTCEQARNLPPIVLDDYESFDYYKRNLAASNRLLAINNSLVLPKKLRKIKECNHVDLVFNISKEGKPKNIKVLKSSNEEFNQAAMDANKQNRFKIKRQNGLPVEVHNVKTRIQINNRRNCTN